MQRFLVKQPKEPKAEEDSKDKVKTLVDHLKATAGQHRRLSERGNYRLKPWFSWDTKERMEAAGLYKKAGFKHCQRKYGEKCPPMNRLRDWNQKYSVQGCLHSIGRPGKLSKEESQALKLYFDGVRQEGAAVDRESIAILVSSYAYCFPQPHSTPLFLPG